ncbi:unnamed protein product [Effrenium voratum]|nr:unnamed protein product [Effrenium voratum]
MPHGSNVCLPQKASMSLLQHISALALARYKRCRFACAPSMAPKICNLGVDLANRVSARMKQLGYGPKAIRQILLPVTGKKAMKKDTAFVHVSPIEEELMKHLHSDGLGVKKVAAAVGRSTDTVSKHLFRKNKTKSGRVGPKVIITENKYKQMEKAYQKLLRQAKGKEVTVAVLKKELKLKCSLKTISRAFWAHGVHFRPLYEKPDLSPEDVDQLATWLQGLGAEVKNFKHKVHLLTISRVWPSTVESSADLREIETMTRQEVADAVRQAFDDPMIPPASAGRPRTRTEPMVNKLVVFQEAHADGSKHFHVAVQLAQPRTWATAKHTLRARNHLACHFSSTHTQFWSAVRYGYIATLSKPDVDLNPVSWSQSLGWDALDLFAESQRPWNAEIWKRRREGAERTAEAASQKRQRFNKLDLTSLILAEGLETQAAVLEYVQNHGTEQAQLFVHQRQRYLKDYLAEAQEWGLARQKAANDRKSDWERLCELAECPCPHGDACTYAHAAANFFQANFSTLSRSELAVALRNILLAGPSKTTRTPMIVGPTNSGKSTLVLPFDSLFGFGQVFHKPALGSSFSLRNILKDKKFLFWDDFRPVEYGQRTVPVTTFLSLFQGQPFEVQVSQSFNDGNVDFEWHRGCLLTAKAQDLWKPLPGVDEEDIRHMKSRVLIFNCTETIAQLKETVPCEVCLSRWVRSGATEHDAAEALSIPTLPCAPPGHQHEPVQGLTELALRASLPKQKVLLLAAEVSALGALNVAELTPSDWQALAAFSKLLPFEQRRFLSAL